MVSALGGTVLVFVILTFSLGLVSFLTKRKRRGKGMGSEFYFLET